MEKTPRTFSFPMARACSRLLILQPIGDGVSDDAEQIQDAMDQIASYSPPGGIIMLSQGTYRIGSTINIISNGIKLRGYGGMPRRYRRPYSVSSGCSYSAHVDSGEFKFSGSEHLPHQFGQKYRGT